MAKSVSDSADHLMLNAGLFPAGTARAPERLLGDGVSRHRDQKPVKEKAMTEMTRCGGRRFERVSFREAVEVGERGGGTPR